MPITPSDDHLSGPKWNEGFERLRATLNPAFTSSFLVFYSIRRVCEASYLEKLTPGLAPSLAFIPLPITVFVFTLPLSIPVWYLTANRMPKWLRNIYVMPAFLSSVAWFDIFADEMVECIRTFGFILDVPPSILGVTILAWGNQVGDFFANRNIAKQGFTKMAMSGCFGEPIFARCFGLGIGFLFVTIQSFPDPYRPANGAIRMDALNLLVFIAQWFVLLLLGVLVANNGFKLTKSLVPILCGAYVVFLVLAFTCVGMQWGGGEAVIVIET
eukprot:SAG31_NODE_5036_length_2787_cov_1.736979_3_plen_271_part_00